MLIKRGPTMFSLAETSSSQPNTADQSVMIEHPKKITLCGSTKFKKAFLEWNRRLTLDGHLVYSVAFWTHTDGTAPDADRKKLLDTVHKSKIESSDAIFVLDIGGYVGDSTAREIDYAQSRGKEIIRLSELFPDWNEDKCEFVRREAVVDF
jgi:hypothetical protein